MSNIRGMGDLENGFLGGTQRSYGPSSRSFFLGKIGWCSSASILVYILCLMFIAQVIVDGLERSKLAEFFLPIFSMGSLTSALASQIVKVVRELKLYKLLTSGFIHGSFEHLFSNSFGILITGSVFEGRAFNFKGFFSVFLSTVVISDLCSLHFEGGPLIFGLGASGGALGLSGFGLGFVIFNWETVKARGQAIFYCLFIGLTVFANFKEPREGVGNYAHFFGFISGALIGMGFASPLDSTNEEYKKKVRLSGWVCLSLLVLIGFVLTFFFSL